MSSYAGGPEDLQSIADALEGGVEVIRHRNEHLERLTEAVTALAISTDALIVAVKGSEQRNRQFRWLIGSIAVLILAAAVGVTILSVRLNRISDDNRAINKAIASCTLPTGACYRDGVARTAAAIATLETQNVTASAAAAFCYQHQHLTTFDSLLACVRSEVAQGGNP